MTTWWDVNLNQKYEGIYLKKKFVNLTHLLVSLIIRVHITTFIWSQFFFKWQEVSAKQLFLHKLTINIISIFAGEAVTTDYFLFQLIVKTNGKKSCTQLIPLYNESKLTQKKKNVKESI